tara:strand:+ start:150 stop:602 length:453 start_codon:yes stop_codon:yes gene_type:complete
METNYKIFRETIYALTDDYQIINTKTKRIKKPSKTKQGYVVYALYYEGRVWTTYLHRFVKEIFHGPSSLEIDHLDRDVSNNHITNLEYVTSRENQYRARNAANDTRGVNYSNGYYRLYYDNTYIKGSNCKTLEQIKKFKKEYDKKTNKWV